MGAGVGEQVLLSAGPRNVEDVVRLAVNYGLGVELLTFALPDILDGDWRKTVSDMQSLLSPVRGMITLHGPFFDMAPGSFDNRINALVMDRYRQALDIAQMLGAKIVVFHANFIASLKNEDYRTGWQKRNISFFKDVAEYAAARGVIAAVENMWEFDPDIICDVLAGVNHPNLRACLDIGHASLFSEVPVDTWLQTVEPWLVHTHLNNNDNILDVHRAFGDPAGVLNYNDILAKLRALPNPPSMTLEMDNTADMLASLPFLGIAEAVTTSAGEDRD